MFRSLKLYFAFCLAFAISASASAQVYSEISIQSPWDRFSLKKQGSNYTFQDRQVALGQLGELLALFSTEIMGACDKLGKPDLTIKAKTGSQWITREFFVDEKIVKSKDQCAPVNGDGLYFAPLHRSWFNPAEQRRLTLNSPLKLLKGETELMAVERHDGEWRNSNPDEFLNWHFFEEFSRQIRDFVVTHHVHKSMAKDKLKLTLISGPQKIHFYKVTGSLWVADLPGSKWLVGANQWSGWLDMEKSQWVDRFSSQLKFITDKGKDAEARRGTIASLSSQWSPSIREALKMILADRNEAPSVQTEAIRILRQKPSMENMGILIKALERLDHPEVLEAITKALKVRNPKGSSVSDKDSSEKIEQIRQEWLKWWKETSHQSS